MQCQPLLLQLGDLRGEFAVATHSGGEQVFLFRARRRPRMRANFVIQRFLFARLRAVFQFCQFCLSGFCAAFSAVRRWAACWRASFLFCDESVSPFCSGVFVPVRALFE